MSSPATGNPVVFDASAVLALLFEEPGAEVVRVHLRTGVIGAVNLAEVLAKLSDHGLPAPEAARAVAILGLEVAPMTEAQAQRSAELRPTTCSRLHSSAAVLAIIAGFGSRCLTMAARWCSRFLPGCSQSEWRARNRRLVLTLRATEAFA